MGGRGSGRWRNHARAALVEETPCIDIVAMRRAGVLDLVGEKVPVIWTVMEATIATGSVEVVTYEDGSRYLDVLIALPGIDKPIVDRLRLAQRARRQLIVCAGCERTFAKVYVVPGRTVGECLLRCRSCARLTHRSAQQHDKRLDQALRDPVGFKESRSRLNAPWSGVVCSRLIHRAFEAKLVPRRGRSWGRRSQTSFKRALTELGREYERKWRRL